MTEVVICWRVGYKTRDVVWERTEWFHFVFPSIMEISAQQRFPGMAIPRARQPTHARRSPQDPVGGSSQMDRDLAAAKQLGLYLVFGVNTHAHADNITGTYLLEQNWKDSNVASGFHGEWRCQGIPWRPHHVWVASDTLKYYPLQVCLLFSPM